MATVSSWTGTMTDIGPMYPFVGSEMLMVVLVAAFWIVWHILQLKAEDAEFREEAERLRSRDALTHVLDNEG